MNSHPPQLLVVGASGTTGLETVRALSRQGVPVRALLRDPAKQSRLDLPGVEIAFGDFGDPASLERAMQGIRSVYLVSPPATTMEASETAVVDAAKAAGVRRIVKLAAHGIGPDAPIQVARYHWAVEEYIRASGLEWTFLHPRYFMQNLLGSSDTIRQGALYMALGDARISLVDARDIGASAAAVLTQEGHAGKTYDISGPEALTYHDLAAEFSRQLGYPVQYHAIPDEALKQALVQAGVEGWFADDLVGLVGIWRQGYGASVSTDVATLTGRPATSFAAFLGDHVGAFRSVPVTA